MSEPQTVYHRRPSTIVPLHVWSVIDRAELAMSETVLLLRLLVAPEASVLPGVVRTGRAALAEALRWDVDALTTAAQTLQEKKLIHADWDNRIVWVPLATTTNPPQSPNVAKSWRRALNDLPDQSQVTRSVILALHELMADMGSPFAMAFGGEGSALLEPAPRPKKGINRRVRFSVLRRDGFRCVYCGATPTNATLGIDHVTPRARGGTDEESNLVTACDPCNQGKGTLPDVALPGAG